MKKYVIESESFEIRGHFPNGLTADDVFYWPQSFTETWEQETFDDPEQAKQVFEKTYRPLAETRRHRGYVEARILRLAEYEYDDDGELVQMLDTIAYAAEPLPAEDDEEEVTE